MDNHMKAVNVLITHSYLGWIQNGMLLFGYVLIVTLLLKFDKCLQHMFIAVNNEAFLSLVFLYY